MESVSIKKDDSPIIKKASPNNSPKIENITVLSPVKKTERDENRNVILNNSSEFKKEIAANNFYSDSDSDEFLLQRNKGTIPIVKKNDEPPKEKKFHVFGDDAISSIDSLNNNPVKVNKSPVKQASPINNNQPLTLQEIEKQKAKLIFEFGRLEKKGVVLPRRFTMASNLDEMKIEYDKLKETKRA